VRQALALSERRDGTRHIHADNHAANIENHGARRFFNGRTEKRHGYSRSCGAGWGMEDGLRDA
jgi:hypothetical protein